jgi:homoserine/homoserine lactone efflux protein
MTTETLIAFGAAAIFFVLLPSPLTALIARFTVQKGRSSALVTLPGFSLGLAAAWTLAALPVAGIVFLLPGVLGALSWAGVAYLMLYVLWSFQDPTIRGAVADNDNLPESAPVRIFAHFISASLGTPRYALVMAAILLQFISPATALQPTLMAMPAVLVLAAIIGAATHVAMPRRMLNRLKRKRTMGSASRKPGARFIARRAVSAGYRRIAA